MVVELIELNTSHKMGGVFGVFVCLVVSKFSVDKIITAYSSLLPLDLRHYTCECVCMCAVDKTTGRFLILRSMRGLSFAACTISRLNSYMQFDL